MFLYAVGLDKPLKYIVYNHDMVSISFLCQYTDVSILDEKHLYYTQTE